MSSYNGSCHCGGITYTAKLSKDQATHTLCHCDTCKIIGGGAYSLNSITPPGSITFNKGEDTLKCYEYKGDSGKSVKCFYCPTCTSHIYHVQEVMGGDIIVRTALLEDGRKNFQPAAEIYGKVRPSWVPEVAKTFDTLPPS